VQDEAQTRKPLTHHPLHHRSAWKARQKAGKMIRRNIVHRVNRRRRDPSSPPVFTNCAISSATIVGGKARLVFTTPITVTGTPHTLASATSGGAVVATATAVSVVNPTTIDLTYAVGPVTGSGWSQPVNDPAIRTGTGGYASAAAGTF
jgi:hypothetical protein